MAERLTERAERIIEPVVGSKSTPSNGKSNFDEAFRLATNSLSWANLIKGFDFCQSKTEEDCRTCQIIGTSICDLVQADIEREYTADTQCAPTQVNLQSPYRLQH